MDSERLRHAVDRVGFVEQFACIKGVEYSQIQASGRLGPVGGALVVVRVTAESVGAGHVSRQIPFAVLVVTEVNCVHRNVCQRMVLIVVHYGIANNHVAVTHVSVLLIVLAAKRFFAAVGFQNIDVLLAPAGGNCAFHLTCIELLVAFDNGINLLARTAFSHGEYNLLIAAGTNDLCTIGILDVNNILAGRDPYGTAAAQQLE